MGHDARVYVVDPSAPTAPPVDISSCISKVELTIEVGKPNEAILHTINVETNAIAMGTEIKNLILPPPLPGEVLVLHVAAPVRRWWGGKRSRFLVEKDTALPTYGMSSVVIAEGWTKFPGPLKVRSGS